MGQSPSFVRWPGLPKIAKPRRGRFQVAFAAMVAMAAACNGALPAEAESAQGCSTIASQAIVGHGVTPAGKWDTETGLRLKALEAEWYNTARGDYFDYARRTVDAVLADPDWNAPGRSPYADALLGEQLMLLYRVSQKPAYYEAAKQIRQRLSAACGLDSHPEREWVPCRAQTFLSEYAAEFQQPEDFSSIASSLASWDAPNGGPAKETSSDGDRLFSVAWMASSLTDSIDSFPNNNPARDQALAALRLAAATLARHQDPQSGLLHDARANTSAAASPAVNWLFVYALLKGVRLGYLPLSFRAGAVAAWHGALARYAKLDSSGRIILSGVSNAFANSTPDEAGQSSLGAFLLASTEMDHASRSADGRSAVVLLDAWYNSQQRKNAVGQMESFHYKWTDWSDSGYSLFGHMLRSAGLATQTLPSAPTPESLGSAAYYIIVSPDIPAKNPNPHYMTSADADVIAAWVQRGGILILLENDPPNADIDHMNLLADRFGIHFDNVLHHHILGEHVEDGRIPVAAGGPLFHQPHTLYMKDTCAILLSGSAFPLLRDRGDVVMATARYGRGIVFANVDPWLYNEYTDGRNNPAIYSRFDNFAAGQELVQWLIQQRPRPPSPTEQKGNP